MSDLNILQKLVCISILLLLNSMTALQAQDGWKTELKAYRDSVDKAFADPELSILEEEDRAQFKALHYFDASEIWNVPVKVRRVKKGKEFKMQTSTDRLPVYRPYAKIRFKVDGKKFRLTVYQSPDLIKMPGYEKLLFLPFTDLSNGDDTYGGGRYLEIYQDDLESGWINFNYAFNPYCAYNSKYSCPIPPLENHLDIRVEAGVKAFGGH